MALVQIDWQYRYPYAANPDGYYYWTNSYFLNVADPMDFPSYVFRVQNPAGQGMMTSCKFNRILVRMPPHSTTVLENAFTFNTGGNRPALPTIIENAVRVHFYIGSKYASYKLLRAAVGTSEIEPDGKLNPSTLAYLQTYYADAAITQQWANDQGDLYTSAVVQPSIHHWQLRHGTKRRERVVIAP